MEEWNFQSFLDKVRHLYGSHQRDLLQPCLSSITIKTDYIRYHYEEINKLEKRLLGGKPTTEKRLLKAGWFFTKDARKELIKIDMRANVQAIVFNLHSLGDVIAHIIYYSLGMNRDNSTYLNEDKISLSTVKDKLKNVQPNGVLELILNLMKNPHYEYLAGLCNVSKHRSIVRSGYVCHIKDGWTEFAFEHFEYKGHRYETRPCNAFFKEAFNFILEVFFKISHQLEKVVSDQFCYRNSHLAKGENSPLTESPTGNDLALSAPP
jgi:hypothetical protein